MKFVTNFHDLRRKITNFWETTVENMFVCCIQFWAYHNHPSMKITLYMKKRIKAPKRNKKWLQQERRKNKRSNSNLRGNKIIRTTREGLFKWRKRPFPVLGLKFWNWRLGYVAILGDPLIPTSPIYTLLFPFFLINFFFNYFCTIISHSKSKNNVIFLTPPFIQILWIFN